MTARYFILIHKLQIELDVFEAGMWCIYTIADYVV